MYKIFLSKRDLKNLNAIDYYICVIEKGLQKTGIEIKRIKDLNDINEEDIVVTTDAHSFFSVWEKNKKQRIIIWFQGIAPEEMRCLKGNNIKWLLKSFVWSYFERIALKHATFCIFVSESMRQHFKKKYGYNHINYFIMPCFNQEINKNCFTEDKYLHPTFVYAGGLAKWQCFEETLLIYKVIKNRINNARLYLYTHEKERAKSIVYNLGIDDVEIKSVEYHEMQKELAGKKYCFLIREDIQINHVATPTKLNTYMAAGCIPIFSNVIDAFKENLGKIDYKIEYKGNMNQLADELLIFENKRINPDTIYCEYKALFDEYYSKEKYSLELCEKLVNFHVL